jgi:hypothetical protein
MGRIILRKELKNYPQFYDIMSKPGKYYLSVTNYKNIVYDNMYSYKKYLDLLQMFTNNHLQLKMK